MASVKTITLPDGSSYDFKATYDVEGNNISETYINKNEKGASSGVAPLNSSGKIDEYYLPVSDFVSESGSFVQFDYSKADVPFSSLKVHINPIQLGSGDPSPTNIREIIGYGSASAIVTGKNMAPQFVSGRSCNPNTGSQTGTAQDGASINCATEEFIPVNFKATNYVIGYDATGLPAIPSCQIFCYDANKEYLGQSVSSVTNPRDLSMNTTPNSSIPFNHEEVCYIKVRYFFASGSGNTWTQAMCDGAHFRMNPGDTLNDYVAYEAPDIYTSDFTSAGTVYGGELDVLSGKLTVTCAGISFDGTETWQQSGDSPNRFFRYIYSDVKASGGSGDTTPRACSHFPNVSVTSSTTHVGFLAYTSGTHNSIYFNFRPDLSSIADSAAWKTYLAEQYSNNTPVTAWAEIATPLTYQLTANQVATLLCQNNVWSDAGEVEVAILPTEISNYIKGLALVVSQNSTSGELTLS